MTTTPPAPARDLVRAEVRKLLEGAEAFKKLKPEEQTQLANHMVKVSEYLAQGQSLTEGIIPGGDDPEGTLKARLAQKPGQVGAEFKAGAVREGVSAFRDMVKTVDFPKFVAGLVHGVFQAVVDASIQQMRAYGELLSSVSKTVDDFARDDVSDGEAREYIANRYPDAAEVDTSGPTAKLKPKEGADAVDFTKDFGSDTSGIDLSDEESERKLVDAAKNKMARERQQMLSTMVLLGINRIVVTNGHINAKVVFDMRASDDAKRRAHAEMHAAEGKSFSAGGGLLGKIFGGPEAGYSHETTVGSSVDDSSESKAAVKAQLSGDVRLQFKSETFPLERMVDVLGMQQISEKAQPLPTAAHKPAAAPAAAAPAPAASAPAPAAAAPAPSGGAR
jgi:hypothetical protein